MSKGIIIEGVYTYEFMRLLRANFPEDNVQLMQITAPRQARLRFLQRRTNLDDAHAKLQMSEMDRIKSSAGMTELLRHANVTIRNNGDMDAFLRKTLEYAEGLFSGNKC